MYVIHCHCKGSKLRFLVSLATETRLTGPTNSATAPVTFGASQRDQHKRNAENLPHIFPCGRAPMHDSVRNRMVDWSTRPGRMIAYFAADLFRMFPCFSCVKTVFDWRLIFLILITLFFLLQTARLLTNAFFR